ncbi:MAG: FHA domain-containing protein [Anaerolineae bacterium]|nr:FHA domain-containing protein [Anaerolineae bacterium]
MTTKPFTRPFKADYFAKREIKAVNMRWKMSLFPPQARLFLQCQLNGQIIHVPIRAEPVLLGVNGSQMNKPHSYVDLTGINGSQHHILRYHCQIERRDDALYLTDLNTRSGTYLNGIRLLPNNPHLLHNRATLTLGSLMFTIQFIYKNQPSTPS